MPGRHQADHDDAGVHSHRRRPALDVRDLRVAFSTPDGLLEASVIARLVGHGPGDQFLDLGLSSSGIPIGPNRPFLLGTDSLGRDKVAWWFVFFPGAALLITTVAFNVLGDSVRDALDPRRDTTSRSTRQEAR